MFRFPITPSLRITVRPPGPIAPRPCISKSTFRCSSRSALASSKRTQPPRSFITYSRPVLRAFPQAHARSFSSSSHRHFYNGGNRYRRFDGPGRQPLIVHLLQKARPIHFVMVGGVIGGVYVYNTDTVEVSCLIRIHPPPSLRAHIAFGLIPSFFGIMLKGQIDDWSATV